MSGDLFQNYLSRAQQLSKRVDTDPSALQELLHLIECGKDDAKDQPQLIEFFKGEYAFYSGQHEIALKHYLEAKGVDQLPFYCYRSSSHIYQKQGELGKALTYANKALEIFPEDPMALALQESLFKDKRQTTDSAQEKIQLAPLPYVSPSVQLEKMEKEPEDKALNVQELAAAIQQLHDFQNSQLHTYFDWFKNRAFHPNNCLYALHGWKEEPPTVNQQFNIPSLSMLTEASRKATGGFYLRWNGKGIAINPGKHFIKYLHEQGLTIYDIHYVLATHEDPESYCDIQELYDLAYHLNRTQAQFHLIHYYLNMKAYQDLSVRLKPHFKRERHSVHCLELFLDSSEIEKIELCPGIRLHYFPAGVPAVVPANLSREKTADMSTALGIRLELFDAENSQAEEDDPCLKVGYVSGVSWSPLLSHHLTACNLLITGMGNTSIMDYERTSYLDRELGYFGVFSLLEEITPKLLICSEFGGREGDIRLEVVRKLKNDLYPNFLQKNRGVGVDGPTSFELPSTILPADIGLYVDLKTLKIKCSETGALVERPQVKVIRSNGKFSRLFYLSSNCCLD